MNHPQIHGYTQFERIGHGGAVDIWRARSDETGQLHLLKIGRPRPGAADDEEIVKIFRRESVVRKAHHPNLARLYDIRSTGDGRLYLDYEYVEGISLEELLRTHGSLDEAIVASHTRVLLEALGALHREGIVHRDIKPANIIMSPARGPVLTDFGALGELMDGGENAGRTVIGTVAGTPRYLSPEQLRAEANSPATDLWGLALVVGEMLTARPMIDASTLPDLIRLYMSQEPMFAFADYPRSLRPFLEACLQRDPAKRPQTAAQAADLLPGAAATTDVIVGSTAAAKHDHLADRAASATSRPPQSMSEARAPRSAAIGGLRWLALGIVGLFLVGSAAAGLFLFGTLGSVPAIDWTSGGLVVAGLAIAGLGLVAARTIAAQGDRAPSAAFSGMKLMEAEDHRDLLSRTIVVQIDEYQPHVRNAGDRLLLFSMLALVREWRDAKSPDEANRAMAMLLDANEKVARKLQPWWRDWDRLVSRGVALVSLASGALAVLTGLRGLF